jgi:predicted TIM-barrel fold metal-dependent hydrolase
MNTDEFSLNLADYGLPTRRQFQEMRIWDTHYHGLLLNGDDSDQGVDKMYDEHDYTSTHERMSVFANRMGIERQVALDVAGVKPGASEMEIVPERDEVLRKLLADEQDRLSGIIRIQPHVPKESCEKMERWIRNGPCIGIKYMLGLCDHPNNDPIIRLARELNAIVFVHTFMVVGGEPRTFTGGTQPEENTPQTVVNLSKRFPDVPIICGHSGGDWELAVQVVRPYPNVYFEFAGSDSHSGAVDVAVRELGADRITWGGHGPSRSFATELSKVLDADLTPEQRRKIFGGNYRRLAEKIFRQKGYSMASRWGVA